MIVIEALRPEGTSVEKVALSTAEEWDFVYKHDTAKVGEIVLYMMLKHGASVGVLITTADD